MDHKMRVKSELSMVEAFGWTLLWIVISVITLGLGLLFAPYSLGKLIINSTWVGEQKMHCSSSIAKQLGHAILWLILIVLSVGILYPLYVFGVARTLLDDTTVI